MMRIKMEACEACGGTGKRPASGQGTQLRAEREKAGISIRALSEAMGYSQAYVTDLERNRRSLNSKLADLYLTKLAQLVNGGKP